MGLTFNVLKSGEIRSITLKSLTQQLEKKLLFRQAGQLDLVVAQRNSKSNNRNGKDLS